MLKEIEDKIIEILKANLPDVRVENLDKRLVARDVGKLPAVYIAVVSGEEKPLTSGSYEDTLVVNFFIEASDLRGYEKAKAGGYDILESIFEIFKGQTLDGMVDWMIADRWEVGVTAFMTIGIDYLWKIKLRR